MREQISSGIERVTIRTTDDKSGLNFVDITLEVEDGQILKMYGVDQKGNKWKVKNLKFTTAKPTRGKHLKEDNDECRCCQQDGLGRIVCSTCPC